MEILVSIIIVNWNGKELLFDCFESLRSQSFTSFCITMVDNGSTDGSVDFVRKEYPEVDIIALNENSGFSVANNIAIRKAKTKYIALLNNDTEVHPLWLQHIVNAMETHPEAGFAACKMLYHSNRSTVDRAGDLYTTAGTALLRGRGKPSSHYKSQEFVFGACAGAAIYRREMFDDIGLFDEDFFLLYEDVDLSFRAQLLGYKCLYVPDAIVYHKVGSSIGHDSSLSIYYTHRNLVWTYIKCMPLGLIPRTIFPHIFYCLGCLFYFSVTDFSFVYIKAKWHAIKNLRHFLKKRKALQIRKRVSNKYIWRLFKKERFVQRVMRRINKVPDKASAHVLIDFTQIPLQKAGVGHYGKHLIEEIAKMSSDKHYFIFLQDDEKCFDHLNCPHVQFIKVKSRFFRSMAFRFLLEQLFIPYLTFKHNIDIVHSLHYTFPLLSLRAKKCVSIHDMSFFKYPKVHRITKRMYFRFFLKLLPKKADRIISISHSTYNDFISITGADHAVMSVIHLAGPKQQENIDSPENETAIINRLGIRSRYLLFVGMIEPRKNLVAVIEAFDRLLQSHNDLQLVIAGPKGWHYRSLFKKIKHLSINDKILLPGYITEEEKRVLMKNAKLFVYPSLYEGFGIPLLEVMSLGVPTITSNVSSMPEVAGDGALLINPDSVKELYEAMKTLLENKQLYNELKEKSLKRARLFSWEKTAKETVKVYEDVLRESNE